MARQWSHGDSLAGFTDYTDGTASTSALVDGRSPRVPVFHVPYLTVRRGLRRSARRPSDGVAGFLGVAPTAAGKVYRSEIEALAFGLLEGEFGDGVFLTPEESETKTGRGAG